MKRSLLPLMISMVSYFETTNLSGAPLTFAHLEWNKPIVCQGIKLEFAKYYLNASFDSEQSWLRNPCSIIGYLHLPKGYKVRDGMQVLLGINANEGDPNKLRYGKLGVRFSNIKNTSSLFKGSEIADYVREEITASGENLNGNGFEQKEDFAVTLLGKYSNFDCRQDLKVRFSINLKLRFEKETPIEMQVKPIRMHVNPVVLEKVECE